METPWFWLLAGMLAVYFILDGYDLGAGIIHPFVGKTVDERRMVIGTIGPFWDGNEVWLIAAGGTLFMAFPSLYAAAFSGFYLPLMIVLWLLILRGLSIELRGHVAHGLWIEFWDIAFCLSSLLLAFIFGAALGNVLRGVPLDEKGWFFVPLWTNFSAGKDPGVLDWFTVLMGGGVTAALTMHGALWVAMKATGEVEIRSRRLAAGLWRANILLAPLLLLTTFAIQPIFREHWERVIPLAGAALVALTLVRVYLRGNRAQAAFMASCANLLAMLLIPAAGLYPFFLPATTTRAAALTVRRASAGSYGLETALWWWIPGMILVAGYFVFVYRRFSGKIHLAGAPVQEQP